MATIAIIRPALVGMAIKNITISGTVKDALGNGLQRRVIAYRNGAETEVAAAANSGAGSGGYALTVNGNHNDEFRVIAIGLPEENSKIIDHVREE